SVEIPHDRRLERLLAAERLRPHRDAVTPPQLTADAPVALLAEPVEVTVLVALGEELHLPRSHGVHRHLREALLRRLRRSGRARYAASGGIEVAHLHEPLV